MAGKNQLILELSVKDSNFFTTLDRAAAKAVETEKRINAAAGDTGSKLAREAEKSANARIREETRYAREVDRINRETVRDAERNERIRENAARKLANEQIKEAKRASNALIAELKQTERAAETSGGIFNSAFAGGAVGGAVGVAAGAAFGFLAQIPGQAIAAGQAIFDLTKSASDYGSAIFDARTQTGLSIETLQGLRLAAQTSGSSFEEVGGFVTKFARLVGAAAKGNEEAEATLSKFGLTPQAALADLDGSLGKVFARINQLPPGIAQMTAAQDAFGKSGARIIPTISSFDGNLDGLKKRATELGLVLSDDALKAADDFGDTLDIVGLQAAATAAKFALEFAEPITQTLGDVSEFFSENSNTVQKWGKDIGDVYRGVREAARSDLATATTDLIAFGVQNSAIGALAESLRNRGAAIRQADFAANFTQNGTLSANPQGSFNSETGTVNFFDLYKNVAEPKINQVDPEEFFENVAKKAKELEEATRKAAAEQKRLTDESTKFVGVYTSLLTQSNSDNPYVRIFNEGDSALQKFKTDLKGLSPEIVDQFTALQEKINFKNLFSARLDTALGAFDLREQARAFRNGAPEQRDSRLLKESDYLRIAQSLPDAQRFLGDNNQFNSDADRAGFITKFLRGQFEDPNKKLQDKLNAQLDIINREVRSSGNSSEALAIADRRALSIAGNVRPEDLSASQREQLANTSEREAVRLEAAEKEANKLRIDQTAAQRSLATDMREILNLAKSGNFKVRDASENADTPTTVVVKDQKGNTIGTNVTGRQMIPEPAPDARGNYSGPGGFSNY